MKYALIQITNGNYTIKSEHGDIEKAKGAYNALCSALHNDSAEFHATVGLVDENMDILEGRYKDVIVHPVPDQEV